jgi:hypothetical protein
MPLACSSSSFLTASYFSPQPPSTACQVLWGDAPGIPLCCNLDSFEYRGQHCDGHCTLHAHTLHKHKACVEPQLSAALSPSAERDLMRVRSLLVGLCLVVLQHLEALRWQPREGTEDHFLNLSARSATVSYHMHVDCKCYIPEVNELTTSGLWAVASHDIYPQSV